MLFDEDMVRFLLYPAAACNGKSFFHNRYHVSLLTFPLTTNHLLFTMVFYTGEKPTFWTGRLDRIRRGSRGAEWSGDACVALADGGKTRGTRVTQASHLPHHPHPPLRVRG